MKTSKIQDTLVSFKECTRDPKEGLLVCQQSKMPFWDGSCELPRVYGH